MRISDWSSDVCSSDLGLILRSDDAGGSWRVLHRGDASIFGLTLGGDGRGYAVGQVGTVLRTDDNGKSWTKLSSGSKANLLSVQSVSHDVAVIRSEEHTSELQSLMRISYAVFCLKKKQTN